MRHGAWILAALALLLSACSHRLTVMTYNVGVFSKYGGSSLPQVAEAVAAAGAGYVSLNELDSCNRRHPSYQLEELSRALGGWGFHFASAFPFAGGGYGNGVVSRHRILHRDSVPLPRLEGLEPRSVAVVETAECVFASTHLDVKDAAVSEAQARIINDWFRARYAGCRKPVFLCGDMNARPGSRTLQALGEAWTLLSGEDPTYPSGEPRACLDYVFCLTEARPVRVVSRQVGAASSRAGIPPASDHLPVVVEIVY